MFYSAAEVVLVYISYACLLLAKESPKWGTGLGIYTPVQQLLQVLLYNLRSR